MSILCYAVIKATPNRRQLRTPLTKACKTQTFKTNCICINRIAAINKAILPAMILETVGRLNKPIQLITIYKLSISL